MATKVALTDLQTHIVYRGTLVSPAIQQGENYDVDLSEHPGHYFRVSRVRGWLYAKGCSTYYVVDFCGKRFKVQFV